MRDKTIIDIDVEECWSSTWKDILIRSDGSMDIEQLKKELYDYSNMILRMSSLTSKLTNNLLSYPTYPVDTIMTVHEEKLEEGLLNSIEDNKEDEYCTYCNRDWIKEDQTC